MKRSTQRILTTHTGNLHRPPDLEELYRQKYAGEPYDAQALAERLRSAVAEVVRKQVELRVDIVDDGEYNKFFFFGYILNRVRGLDRRAITDRMFLETTPRFAQFYADTQSGPWVLEPPSLTQLLLHDVNRSADLYGGRS